MGSPIAQTVALSYGTACELRYNSKAKSITERLFEPTNKTLRDDIFRLFGFGRYIDDGIVITPVTSSKI